MTLLRILSYRPGLISLLSCSVLAFVLCGCVHSKDVSNLHPFADYIGKSVTLNRPMILVKESGGILGYTDVTRAHATPYVMMETDGCKNGVEAIRRKEYERYSGRHIKHAS